MDRFTITKTRRWGNVQTEINNVYSVSRGKTKRDDVIRMANDLISGEDVMTNEEIEYEVLLSYDNGNTEFIHRVEKSCGAENDTAH